MVCAGRGVVVSDCWDTVIFSRVKRSPAARRTVVARAPTRIDLGGGWTDVPPYCDEQGGYVCNIAIDCHAIATVREERYGDPPTDSSVSPLVAAALRRTETTGATVEVESRFPHGSGLGGSSSAVAAILGALARWHGRAFESAEGRATMAEHGRRIEVEDLHISGGRQDHYAATHGGALGLTFTDVVTVQRLHVSPATIREFERRSTLVYTGESRISGETIRAVLDAYRGRNTAVRNALASMKALGRTMAAALETGNLDELGALVAEHWIHQRSLHPAIPTARIDEIVTRAQAAGACGWKATGASGGGCVWVLARTGTADVVRAEIAPLGEIIPFRVDTQGLTAS